MTFPSILSSVLALSLVPELQGPPPACPPPPADPAGTLHREASALLDQRQFVKASDLFQQSLDRRREALGPQHELVAEALHNLSYSLSRAGRGKEAVDLARECLEIVELDRHRPSHAVLARRHLAEVAEHAGQFDVAWREIETVVAEAEQQFGLTPLTGEAHEIAGRLACRFQELEIAAEHYRWSSAIYEKYFGVSEPTTAVRPMLALAHVLARQSHWNEAVQVLHRASAWLEAGNLVGHPVWQEVRRLRERSRLRADDH